MVHKAIETLYRLTASHPVTAGILAAMVVAILAAILYAVLRHKPTPEEIELGRRVRLMDIGRLIDGTIVDPGEEMPQSTVMYSYRVGGVEYQCAQDLTVLGAGAERYRVDLPVQVRYDPQNPYNSIVAAEGWSGLRER